MTTYIREFDSFGYAMQTEVDLPAQRKRPMTAKRLIAKGYRAA